MIIIIYTSLAMIMSMNDQIYSFDTAFWRMLHPEN